MRTLLKLAALPVLALSVGLSHVACAESTGQYIDDATITTKVKAAFVGDEQIKAMQISVTTDHGVVQLTGAVDTASQEAEAVKDANQVNGVKSVKDMLTVKGTQAQ